jgi:hypothetical protein
MLVSDACMRALLLCTHADVYASLGQTAQSLRLTRQGHMQGLQDVRLCAGPHFIAAPTSVAPEATHTRTASIPPSRNERSARHVYIAYLISSAMCSSATSAAHAVKSCNFSKDTHSCHSAAQDLSCAHAQSTSSPPPAADVTAVSPLSGCMPPALSGPVARSEPAVMAAQAQAVRPHSLPHSLRILRRCACPSGPLRVT